MADFEEISKSWGLDFWAKAIGIFMPISIITGYAFLNGYYAAWWGFTDYSISKEVCVVVMIWFVLIAYLADRFGRIFDFAVEKMERSKRGKWSFFAFSFLLVAVPQFSYTQQLAKRHHIYLPPGQSLAILVCILYVALLVILAPLLSWLREFKKEEPHLVVLTVSPKAANRSSGLHLLPVAIGISAMFLIFEVFAVTYHLIPARYGGGQPDPIQFWVPRSAQAIFSGFACQIAPDKQVPRQAGVGGPEAEYLHYSNFYLVHEGSDNLILISRTCDQVLQVPKNFIKGRQWRNPSFIASSQQQPPAKPAKANISSAKKSPASAPC